MNMIHRCLCWTLSFSMICYSVLPAYAQEVAQTQVNPEQGYQRAMDRLDQVMRQIEVLRGHIDRSQFEPDALVSRLDFDGEQIVRYVTEQLRFQQYPGLLRGVRGTLLSQAGNALDQSLLLASLLKDAGYDARILRGALDETQALSLLHQMMIPHGKPASSGDSDGYRASLEKLARLAGVPEDRIEALVSASISSPDIRNSQPFREAETDRDFIMQQLKLADIDLQNTEITDQLLREAQDYFWVEYRSGPSDPWLSAHPAFQGGAGEPSELIQTEVFADTIPDELQHRFRFQVFIEQKTGNKLTTTALTKPWERPVANLLGVSLTYKNIPDGLTRLDDLQQPAELARNTNFLVPDFSVNGSPQALQNVFDLNGVIVDKSALSMGGAAGLFKTLGEKMETGLQGAATIDKASTDGEDFRALSAQWLEFTLIAPGGAERTIKRYVIDRIGAANRKEDHVALANFTHHEEAVWRLARNNSFLLNPGAYSEAYILDRYLERLIQSRPLLELTLHNSWFPDQPKDISPELMQLTGNTTELWLSDAIDMKFETDPGVVDYRHEPGLLIVNSGLHYADSGGSEQLVVDIASNQRRALRLQGNHIVYEPERAILAGTWATRAEQVELTGPARKSVSQWSTREAFRQARAGDWPIHLFRPGTDAGVATLKKFTMETRNAINRDLEAGYAVIVPQAPDGKLAQAGWWRVNPISGETLGMINEGLGSEATKYGILVSLVGLKVAILMAVPGLMDCLNKKQCSKAGCYKAAGIGVFMGYSIGFAVGLITAAVVVPSTAAAAAVLTVEVAAGVAGAANIGISRGIDVGNALGVLPQLPSCIE